MKAIILSAGQGSRLLPLTENCPKCLLPIGDEPLLVRQIQNLERVGVREVVVIVGFGARNVELCVERLRRPDFEIRCVFNPFFGVADNLASCWMARHYMTGDFILLNGDTLFEPAVGEGLLSAPRSLVALAIDRKTEYDSDDMKVRLDGSRLIEVGKTLSSSDVDGESIGMIRFQGDGPKSFTEILDQTMRQSSGLNWWYLKAVGVLADRGMVETHSIEGLLWTEVDFPHDLERARKMFGLAADLNRPPQSDAALGNPR